jgi:hypothetical protein
MVVGNGRISVYETLNLIPDVKIDSISIVLPVWFRTYNGKKFIKIYGTQLNSIVQDTDNDTYKYDVDTPLETTIQCNLARDVNTGILIEPFNDILETSNPTGLDNVYSPSYNSKELINELYDGYVLTVNNFYTPKIYEYTDPAINELHFWFKSKYGTKIPIFYVHAADTEDIDVRFLLFKIECELINL